MNHDEILELKPHEYLIARKIRKLHGICDEDSGFEGPRKSLWIYGKPGVGKSRACYELSPYMKNLNKWWDGYTGQKTVLIDEMTPKAMDYLEYYIKIWADPWKEIRAEIKGGTRKL